MGRPAREEGSAPVASIFAMVLVLLLALGVIQVALVLYGRNVVLSATHEGARAAAERGRDAGDARSVAMVTIRRAAGGLVRDLDVKVAVGEGVTPVVAVEVTGRIGTLGPVPISIPVRARSTARRVVVVP